MEINGNTPSRGSSSRPLKRHLDDPSFHDPDAVPISSTSSQAYPMIRLGRRAASPPSPSSAPPKRRLLDPADCAPGPPRNPLLDNYVVPSYKPYWYDDGNVVLVVQDHLFKLRSQDLACSDIFADMFSLAQPEGAETLDGCPVVQLTDKPQDWMLTLQWVDDPVQFWQKYDIPYETIASTLRISTKYEITALRRIAARHVYRIWPRNARKMDERAFRSDRLDAIQLASDCDLPDILPTIFYSLAIDKQLGRLPPAAEQALSPFDQQRLVAGMHRLSEFQQHILQDLDIVLSEQCAPCTQHISSYWHRKLDTVQEDSWLLRVLEAMYGSLEDVAEGVCPDCLAPHWDLVDSSLKTLEKMIPRFFGF
ncbi:hypothetical protein EVG20_g10278 [Dentipellis fragilis]|uniref:BTB domain-containing protein n=1 Tax=Dentipellis fragilis TaxID=205917 RepID=A0A4Y9XUH4_9AGAM|nr:hypothetical protein EVG20_g10278 [Dentipellis fragilis]